MFLSQDMVSSADPCCILLGRFPVYASCCLPPGSLQSMSPINIMMNEIEHVKNSPNGKAYLKTKISVFFNILKTESRREANWYLKKILSAALKDMNSFLPSAAYMRRSVNWVKIGSDNGLSPGWCQAIIWTKAGIFSIGPLGLQRDFNLSKKCFWKCRLRNDGHFVQGGTS